VVHQGCTVFGDELLAERFVVVNAIEAPARVVFIYLTTDNMHGCLAAAASVHEGYFVSCA
jgi:hypothetical protein